jgi:hypothetical protein
VRDIADIALVEARGQFENPEEGEGPSFEAVTRGLIRRVDREVLVRSIVNCTLYNREVLLLAVASRTQCAVTHARDNMFAIPTAAWSADTFAATRRVSRLSSVNLYGPTASVKKRHAVKVKSDGRTGAR